MFGVKSRTLSFYFCFFSFSLYRHLSFSLQHDWNKSLKLYTLQELNDLEAWTMSGWHSSHFKVLVGFSLFIKWKMINFSNVCEARSLKSSDTFVVWWPPDISQVWLTLVWYQVHIRVMFRWPNEKKAFKLHIILGFYDLKTSHKLAWTSSNFEVTVWSNSRKGKD